MRLQLISVVIAAGGLLLVFELVRRRQLMERYALLWLFAATVLLVFAAWSDALRLLAKVTGVKYGPSALFAISLGFMLVLMLHFSLVISRLADQNRVLAQRLAMLQQRVEALATEQPEPVAAPDDTPQA
jgi:hypothetical protein